MGLRTGDAERPQRVRDAPRRPRSTGGSTWASADRSSSGKTALRFTVDGNRSYDTADDLSRSTRTAARSRIRCAGRSSRPTSRPASSTRSRRNQTLRTEYRRSNTQTENQGVGDVTLAERATERTSQQDQVRFQIQGVVARRAARVSPPVQPADQRGVVGVDGADASTCIDAFNKRRRRRQQQQLDAHGRSRRQLRLQHRTQARDARRRAVRGRHHENFDARNAAGTFTFSNLEAYNAGLPLQFTQRRGQVDTSFNQYQFGLYWQDDIRVNKNLSVSLGVRQEMQSLIGDKLNVMPRFGATWNAPGKVVIRGGYGTVLRLVRHRPLRPDAARERRRAARPADPQSRLPDPVRRRRPRRAARRPRAGGAGPRRCPTSTRRRSARSARSRRTCSSRRPIRCCAAAT